MHRGDVWHALVDACDGTTGAGWSSGWLGGGCDRVIGCLCAARLVVRRVVPGEVGGSLHVRVFGCWKCGCCVVVAVVRL